MIFQVGLSLIFFYSKTSKNCWNINKTASVLKEMVDVFQIFNYKIIRLCYKQNLGTMLITQAILKLGAFSLDSKIISDLAGLLLK